MIDAPRSALSAVAVLLLLCAGTSAEAQQQDFQLVRGAVTYVTSRVVYGDLGRRQGLREGDTLEVRGQDSVLARLTVTHLASGSFAADVLERRGVMRKGDVVVAKVPSIVVPPRTVLLPDSAAAPSSPVRRRAATEDTEDMPAAAGRADGDATVLRGRLALQYYALYNSAISGAAFSQPAVVLNATADHLFRLPLRFQYYSNHRYDARAAERRSGSDDDRWRSRFYQFSLQYGTDTDHMSATLGRFVPYAVGGIGTVDGAMLVMREGAWEGGLLAGSQPGYRQTELSLRDQKIAAYAAYRTEGKDVRLRSSAAFAQTYRDGALDRGYFYLVNSMGFGRALTLYQNASIDLYDASSDGDHFSPYLTDLYLSATWRPERWMALTGSFATRRSVYFLRSFAAIPDSLFRESRLRNYQLSAGITIPGGMYASVTGSLRTQENSDKTAAAVSARFTAANAFDTHSNVYILGSWADNIFNTSTSYGLEINRDIVAGLYTAVRLQQYRYAYASGGRSIDRTTLSLESYYRLSTLLYLTVSYERYWEDTVTNDRVYAEVSARLR